MAWLCWAATWRAAPLGPRNTMGTFICPPDIWYILAALLRIWSNATAEKFQVMNSMIGRRPDHGRAHADAGEARLGDGRVDHALGRRTARACPR